VPLAKIKVSPGSEFSGLSKPISKPFPGVTRKMVLKITLVLVHCRRIQARHKDLVKITLKFIRRGIEGRKERSISCSPHRK
jgi:hypothetical protein